MHIPKMLEGLQAASISIIQPIVYLSVNGCYRKSMNLPLPCSLPMVPPSRCTLRETPARQGVSVSQHSSTHRPSFRFSSGGRGGAETRHPRLVNMDMIFVKPVYRGTHDFRNGHGAPPRLVVGLVCSALSPNSSSGCVPLALQNVTPGLPRSRSFGTC